MRPQVFLLAFSELEHEVRRKALDIAFHGLVQALGANPVKLGQIRIENDLFVADAMDECGEFFRNEQGGGTADISARFSFGGWDFPGGHGGGRNGGEEIAE